MASTPSVPPSNASNNWRSAFRSDLFSGRTALVTGGGTGIGRAIATELACLGATVVIASRTEATCQTAAAEMNQQIAQQQRQRRSGGSGNGGGRVVVGPSTNIRKEDDVRALIEFCIQQTGALHYVVNNAGGQFISPAEDLSRRGFAAVVETNLVGTFLVCREAYTQYMRDHGEGCAIVNITLGNRNGMPYMSHSGASRAGIENLTATLCTEWIESGVRINCVRPGIIWTDSGFAAYGEAGEDYLKRIVPSVPAKRLGSPEEVSSAVVWLLSEGASYITGTTVCVDGGSSYTLLPTMDIPDETHLKVYGTLPLKAKL